MQHESITKLWSIIDDQCQIITPSKFSRKLKIYS